MGKLTRRWVGFIRGDEGPTAVEYAVMIALVVLVCVGGIALIGGDVLGLYSVIGSDMGGGTPAPPPD